MKGIKKHVLALLVLLQMSNVYGTTTNTPNVTSKKTYNINFDEKTYQLKTINVNGKEVKYRVYENIVYVQNPIDTKYEVMNFYVPEVYYSQKIVNGYTANTAPILLPNSVGGYMPAEPGKPGGYPWNPNEPNTISNALSKGYIVAAPGARGRTTQDENGKFIGKAPAAIVDLKAAVKYLHFNDNVMPGDANKIISNGTSAGGALSSLLGASGNNKDYEPYLKEIGAADAKDDIFAVSAYCPITDLDHADMAYEWLLEGVNNFKRLDMTAMLDFNKGRQFVEGTMTDSQIKLSKELASDYPSYINSLNLKDKNGNKLTLDKNGNGIFKDYIKSLIIASAQKAMDNGSDLSKMNFISIKNSKVIDLDLDKYYAFVGRMKVTPDFDGVDLSNGENDLFGTADKAAQHFTAYSKANSTANGTMADNQIIKMMNPLNYIDEKGTTTSKYWRIRHGAIDVDTSVSISATLATTLQNKGYNVDYFVPWGVFHSGDYDLNELFAWIDSISK